MAGGGDSTIGGGGGGAIEGPPSIYAPSSVPRFCSTNYGTQIFHNGITWTFSSGVTWGTYVSGEPWVLVTGAGITVSSIQPGLTLVSGNPGLCGAGITFWINGSFKNPQSLKLGKVGSSTSGYYGVTYEEYKSFSADQRTQGIISGVRFTSSTNNMGFSYNELSLLPLGLTSGDMLVSNYSSFNPNNDYHTNGSIRYVDTTVIETRTCLESRAVLSAVASIPACDEFRPPIYWIQNDIKNRPSFTEDTIVRNPQSYVLNITDFRDWVGYTLSTPINSGGITYSGLVNKWNNNLLDSMVSAIIPSWHSTLYQSIMDLRSVYGFEGRDISYGGYIKDESLNLNFYSIFAPWVPSNLRLLAQRRIIQYAIDCYGYYKGGGRSVQNGNHLQCVTNPYVRFLGWVYDNASILNYEKSGISFSETYFDTKLTGTGPGSPKGKVNVDQVHKAFMFDEYGQLGFVYGLGETGSGKTAFKITNPNIGITHNFGLSGSGQSLVSAQGATGIGWFYKYSGITLNPTNPATTVGSVSIRNIKGAGLSYVATGQFGVLNLSSQFKPRNDNTLPVSNPMKIDQKYVSSGAYTGLFVKIVEGGGSGSTEYRTLGVAGIDQQNAGTTYNVTLTLDRPFQNGNPDTTSVINIYPYRETDNYPLSVFNTDLRFNQGVCASHANFVNQHDAGYSYRSYGIQLYPDILRSYSVLKYLGITQDNHIIDNFYNLYFSGKYPKYAKHNLLSSSAYGFGFTSQFEISNLVSMMIKHLWGASGDYIGILSAGTNGICGEDYPTFLSSQLIDSYDLNYYTYTVSEVSHETRTGEILEGLGVVYDNPVTPYRIKAIIGNNIIIDTSSYSFIDYAEFTEQFGYPSLFINGNKARLILNSNVIVDGIIPFIYEDDVTPPSLGTQVSYVLTNGYSYTQHSLQTLLPSSGISGAQYVTSTLPISQMFRRRNILTFTLQGIGITSDYYDEYEGVGVTFNTVEDVSIKGEFAYINIGGNVNSTDDWFAVDINNNMNTYTIDISNVPNNDLLGVPLNLRFFTSPINIFEYEIGQTIKYKQDENVYSKF